ACEWAVRRPQPGSSAQALCSWCSRLYPLLRRLRDRQSDRKDRARTIRAIGGGYLAMRGFDETARNGQAQPGTGTHLVTLPRAIEFVEDALEIRGRNALSFVHHLKTDRFAVAPAPDGDGRTGRRVLRGIVEQVEKHLFEQHRIHHHHG